MYLMEASSLMSMTMMMTRVTVTMMMSARGVFAVMEKPLSVSQPTVRLFNPLAAPIRDRATIMEILLM